MNAAEVPSTISSPAPRSPGLWPPEAGVTPAPGGVPSPAASAAPANRAQGASSAAAQLECIRDLRLQSGALPGCRSRFDVEWMAVFIGPPLVLVAKDVGRPHDAGHLFSIIQL